MPNSQSLLSSLGHSQIYLHPMSTITRYIQASAVTPPNLRVSQWSINPNQTLKPQTPMQPQISTTRPHPDLVHASPQSPLLFNHIPNAQVPPHQLKYRLPLLPLPQR